MASLFFSDIMFDSNTLMPYVEFTYKDKIGPIDETLVCLMSSGIEDARNELIEVIVDGFQTRVTQEIR